MRRSGNFKLLLGAASVSNLGDGVTLAALPLLVATLSRDPLVVAGVAFVARLPWLLFALPVGVLTDRWDRRVIMWRANACRFVVLSALAVAVATAVHSVWAIYVAAAVAGAAEVFYDNSAQTLLPSLVQPQDLHQANGQLGAAELVANGLVGPPLGAALFAVAAALPLFFDAATFGVSALLIVAIPGVYRPPSRPGPSRLRTEMKDGIAWLWRHDLLRILAILLAVTNFAGNAGLSILVLFAQDDLGLGDLGFGLLLTAGAAGGLAGSLAASRIHNRFGPGPTMLTAYVVIATALLLIAFTTSGIVAGLLIAAVSFAGMTWNVITVSARQVLIPDDMLGRVNSVYRFLGWGAIPLGAIAGGFVAAATNVNTVFVAAGLLQLTVAAFAGPRLLRRASVLETS
ncbi:MAG: MFS transporter [Acidimicrobiales bacterium]